MSELAQQLIAENKARHARGEDARVLDLGKCGLTEIPEEVFELEWLEELNFTNWKSNNRGNKNQLTGISDRISNLTNLERLDYRGEDGNLFQLDSLTPIRGLKNLKYLCLAHTTLSDISDIRDLEHLLYINLSYSKVESFAPLADLEHFVALTLHHDEEVDITPVCQKGQLRYLDISDAKLSSYQEIKHLTSLETLKIANLSPEDFSCFRGLVNLKVLGIYDLSYQEGYTTLASFSWKKREPITNTSFFSHLSNLTNLERLEFSLFYFNDMEILKRMNKLQELTITENSIKDITSIAESKSLKKFHFTAMEKINDYSTIGNLTNLVDLQITGLGFERTNLVDISWIKPLHQLEKLTLKGEIEDISPLKHLTHIISLNLEGNQIQDISVLSNLPFISQLNLSGTPIDHIHTLASLSNLESLDISQTNVTDLEPLSGLENLRFMNLENTKVKDLKPILRLIQKGTPIEYEHGYENIGEFLSTNPQYIFIKDAPIEQPPLEIIKQGNAAILNWFSERSKTQFQNTEIKLIFIGNSTAGKTSLSRYLRERVYEQGQPTTHGIQNYRWEPEGRELQVNIWDFGGQEYYHATHRLFLSRNSVYVLVWDACTDKGGTELTEIWYPEEGHSSMAPLEHFPHLWWLKNIRHFTSGSNPPVSVLLVQNKSARDGIKRLSSELEKPPFSLLPEWIDNHIDIAASAQHQNNPQPDTRKWQRSFEEFEERLFDKLKSQLTHYEFAIYHRDIRDHVRAMASGDNPVNEMSWTGFEEMCRDIEPDAKMDLVQIYLRDITGDILYFEQNERLRHRVFLRPDWVCNRIYAILSRKVLERQGLFDLAWVREALQCGESEALDFVELMREFQLVFAENDETGTPTGNYVAPQYLPDTCTHPGELDGAKKYANLAHAFTLWFPEFLPKSHIARFVAHWGGNAKQRLFWKNGLLFQTAGCTALVERSKEFKIRVDIQQGDTTKRAAAMGRIFQSLLELEDGQANFGVSLNAKDFVWWPDAQEAIHTHARQVKTFPTETTIYIDVQPFMAFQKPVNMAKKVFISYSKHDRQDYLVPLLRYLSPLARGGWLAPWDDSHLLPGEEWDDRIKQEIEGADIILLLVSDHSLNTEYIWNVEIEAAMRRHEAGTAWVVPVILSKCLWTEKDRSDEYIFPPAKLNALPAKGKPVSEWERREEAWDEVAKGVKRICTERKG